MPDAINPFAAPQASTERPPEQVWAAEQPEAMRKVKLGLTLVYTGIVMSILSLIAVGVAGATLDRAPQDLAWILLGFMGALFLAGVFVIVGQVYCRAIPAETRARTLVDASLACHAATIVSTVGQMFLPEEFGGEYEWAIRLVNNLLTLVGLTCFTLFMRRVALVIHRPDLAKRATRTIVIGIISVGLLAMVTAWEVLAAYGTVASSGMAHILIPIGAIGFLVALIMYANLVTYLRKAITV